MNAIHLLGKLKGDKIIWMIFFFLLVYSVLAVYSSTGSMAYRYAGGNTEAYLFKHLGMIAMSIAISLMCYRMHYARFLQLAPIMLVISIVLLIYTILFGIEVNDARRWVALPGLDITFQSSDFAKLALIIYLARSLSMKQDHIKDFKSAFVPLLVPIIVVCGLIAPADLSSAALLFMISVLMLFVGRVHLKYIFMLLGMGVVLISFLITIGQFLPDKVRIETWSSRMESFFEDTDGDYQVQQAKIAIAGGEFFGKGPGKSVQRNFLPYAYADFIFAIIMEEYGLILGGFVVIALYLWLFLRCIRLVTNSQKTFGAMLAAGLGMSLIVFAYANIAVSLNLIPVTGLTLPMISMGGTSMLFTSMAFGVILSVSRYIEKTQKMPSGQTQLAGYESHH